MTDDFWAEDRYDIEDKDDMEKQASVFFKKVLEPNCSSERESTQFYLRRLKSLEKSTMREMLMTIMAECNESLEDASLELIKSEASFQQLCDLIHMQF